MKGKAPGIAPTKTDKGVTNFSGVYTEVYKKIDTAASSATFELIIYNMNNPIIVDNTAKTKAVFTEILFVGSGLFLVLTIKASKSFSII